MKILFIPFAEQKFEFSRTPLLYRTLEKEHELTGIKSSNSAVGKIFTYSKAKNAMRKQDFDIIFCSQPENAFLGAILSRKYKKPLLFDSHGSAMLFAESLGKNFLYSKAFSFFEKASAEQANAITIVSEKDKKELLKHCFDAKKVFVLPTWIELGRISKCPQETAQEMLGFSSNKKHLIFFGSLGYRPNIVALDFITKSLAPALKESNCIIHVCGSGKPPIAKQDNIEFHGFVEDISLYIQACDATIAPIWQGVGILEKVLLSMACAKPTVTTGFAAEGIPELADGKNSYLANTPREFVEKAMQALSNEEAKKMGKNARSLIEEKYSSSNAEKLLEIVEAVAE